MSKKIIVCAACNQKNFHQAKGLCKRCYDRRYIRERRKQNPEYFRALDKRRWFKRREKQNAGRKARYHANQEIEREKQRVYRNKNRAVIQAQQREYRTKNREKINARNRAYSKIRRKRYPEKSKTRDVVHNAVARGEIPSPLTLDCKQCGNPAMGYHHHKGYAPEHALDVIPLCHPCHGITRQD